MNSDFYNDFKHAHKKIDDSRLSPLGVDALLPHASSVTVMLWSRRCGWQTTCTCSSREPQNWLLAPGPPIRISSEMVRPRTCMEQDILVNFAKER